MDSATRTARSPIVRARRSFPRLHIVRGREYKAIRDFANQIVVLVNGARVLMLTEHFTPVNAAARKLLKPPVPPEVARYRRRVLKELRALAESWGAPLTADAVNVLNGIELAITAARKVRP